MNYGLLLSWNEFIDFFIGIRNFISGAGISFLYQGADQGRENTNQSHAISVSRNCPFVSRGCKVQLQAQAYAMMNESYR